MLVEGVRKQSIQLFENLEGIFGAADESLYRKKTGGFPFWRQLYHAIHSIDKNFEDPAAFKEPGIHGKNLDSLTIETEGFIEKEILYSYFREVKSKVEAYLNLQTDETLEEAVHVRGMEVTRLELILAQYRHIMYHVGYLHCCLKIETGNAPEYVGLYKARPEK
jgi:hypothetical protein